MKASFQLDLEQANLRYPANRVAGKRVSDNVLTQFGPSPIEFLAISPLSPGKGRAKVTRITSTDSRRRRK